MPITKSAVRALRQSKRRRKINLKVKKSYKEAVKVVRQAVREKNPKQAKKALPEVYRRLDFAAKKKVIHKNKAARLKSRLTKLTQEK